MRMDFKCVRVCSQFLIQHREYNTHTHLLSMYHAKLIDVDGDGISPMTFTFLTEYVWRCFDKVDHHFYVLACVCVRVSLFGLFETSIRWHILRHTHARSTRFLAQNPLWLVAKSYRIVLLIKNKIIFSLRFCFSIKYIMFDPIWLVTLFKLISVNIIFTCTHTHTHFDLS